MKAINKVTQFFFILFHACFAGVLSGQVINLYVYKEPVLWASYVAAGLFGGLLFLLLFFKKRLQQYIFRHSSFRWVHFSTPVLYGVILLLFSLPVVFNFDESFLIITALQLCSLIALTAVAGISLVIHLGVLQEVYAKLLQFKRMNRTLSHILWLAVLATSAFLSIYMYRTEGSNSLYAIIKVTLYIGTVMFLILWGVKFLVHLILSSLDRYINIEELEQEQEQGKERSMPYGSGYYDLETNPERVLMESSAEDRPAIFGKIRQIPLIDKIEELESIHHRLLPGEREFTYTIAFLRKLKDRLSPSGTLFDFDSVTEILEIKAYIRTVIAEGNPLLVQKLLNDNRPEVKKAAIFATIYFKEPGLIPALINLLKDPEYAFSAKEALLKMGSQCLPYLRSAKYRNKENTFFMDHCLDITERYKSSEARDFLTEMLNEPQKRFRYRAAMALLKNGYELSSVHKNQILQFTENLIGTIAVQREVLYKLKNKKDLLAQALSEEINEQTALAIDLLEAFLPKPVLYLVKSLVRDGARKNSCSLYALIDLFFPLVYRTKYKILLGSSRKKNIAPKLQAEYLNEQVCFNHSDQKEAVKHILKMDYSQIGIWLRVCALKKLAQDPVQQIPMHVFAEIFNKNILLQEVAAEVLYDLNFNYYFLYMQRLHPDRAKVLKHRIETHKILEEKGLENHSNLLYHQVLFLKSASLFKAQSYESMARNIGLFSLMNLPVQKKELDFDPYKLSGYWIVNQGEFAIFYRGEQVLHARKGDLIDMSFLSESERNTVSFRPLSQGSYLHDNSDEKDKSSQNSSVRVEKTLIPEEIRISFIEYYTLNKLYLRPGHSNGNVLRPKINHAAKLHLV